MRPQSNCGVFDYVIDTWLFRRRTHRRRLPDAFITACVRLRAKCLAQHSLIASSDASFQMPPMRR
ncbi:hypothetical protein HanHA300_Chr02g0042331 [Helianthus annuus]|nr:hypothetical protein HanHA300_Chr02g0042331 [Helianthus annuus]KAJ0617806.1 hypothetical protein HanHA89_Chr02g0045991 [Helianthus annuus]